MSKALKSLVSKKKRRFQEDGYDLDLTYITKNIVAMGFPSEKLEGVYRNSMDDVVKFFDKRHMDHYKVYNLCSERNYNPAKFHNRVSCYPFDDHNAPPFELIKPFCEDAHEWLTADKENIIVVHCKAGKGRTGVMIAAYLVHCGMWEKAEDALAFYGAARTQNQKGVTIPSQQRYVLMYGHMIRNNLKYAPVMLMLKSLRLFTVPNFNGGTCCPYFTVSVQGQKIYASKVLENVNKNQPIIEIQAEKPILVCGDVKVELFHKERFKKEKMCHFWFNTFFIQNNTLTLRKPDIDKANKDKKAKIFKNEFFIEVTFTSVPTAGEEGANGSGTASSSTTTASASGAAASSSAIPVLQPVPLPRKANLEQFKDLSVKDEEEDEDEDLSDDDDDNEWPEGQ